VVKNDNRIISKVGLDIVTIHCTLAVYLKNVFLVLQFNSSLLSILLLIKGQQFILYDFFFFKDFIYLFDRERAQAGEAAGRGRGRSRLPAEQGA